MVAEFALILTLNDMIEHVYKNNLWRMFEIQEDRGERQFTPNVQYKCVRSKAKLEENIDGQNQLSL